MFHPGQSDYDEAAAALRTVTDKTKAKHIDACRILSEAMIAYSAGSPSQYTHDDFRDALAILYDAAAKRAAQNDR